LVLGIYYILYYYILYIIIIYYTTIFYHTYILLLFSSSIPHPFLPILIPPSFILYLSILIYYYLYSPHLFPSFHRFFCLSCPFLIHSILVDTYIYLLIFLSSKSLSKIVYYLDNISLLELWVLDLNQHTNTMNTQTTFI
jgi:hypothetical protein